MQTRMEEDDIKDRTNLLISRIFTVIGALLVFGAVLAPNTLSPLLKIVMACVGLLAIDFVGWIRGYTFRRK